MSQTDNPKYWFEDFYVGRTFDLPGPTLSEEQIIDFASKYDPQYFHADPVAAKQSPYGGVISSGWLTVVLSMRMAFDGYIKDTAGLGSPGVENLLWLKPVRPGDTLRMRVIVLESRPSASKPDRGLIKHRWDVFNQHDEKVMEMTGVSMFLRRPAGV